MPPKKKSNPAAPVIPVTAGTVPSVSSAPAQSAALQAQTAEKLEPVLKQAEKAVVALLAWLERKREGESGKQQLFEEDEEEDIFLTFGLKHIPKACPVSPYRIAIPHSLYGRENQNMCLITKDSGKEERQFLMEDHPVANLEEVMSVSQLRNNHKQYKDRRTLVQSFKLFLADERIVPLLPPLLGKLAFSKKKHPVPVDISKRAKMVSEIEKVRDSALLYLKAGSSVSVKVANTSFTRVQILANIRAALPAIVQFIPKGGLKNIKSVFLKTATSTALPLFSTDEPYVVDPEEAAKEEDAKKERQRQKELRRQADLRKQQQKDRRQLDPIRPGGAGAEEDSDEELSSGDDDDEKFGDMELDLEDLSSEDLIKILGRPARDEVEAAMLQLRVEAQERWKHETEGLGEEQIQEVLAHRRGLHSSKVNNAGLPMARKKRAKPVVAAAAAGTGAAEPVKQTGKRKRPESSGDINTLEHKHLMKQQKQEAASATKKPKLAEDGVEEDKPGRNPRTKKGSVAMLKKISQAPKSAPAHKLAKLNATKQQKKGAKPSKKAPASKSSKKASAGKPSHKGSGKKPGKR